MADIFRQTNRPFHHPPANLNRPVRTIYRPADCSNRAAGGFIRAAGSINRAAGCFNRMAGSFDHTAGAFSHTDKSFNRAVGASSHTDRPFSHTVDSSNRMAGTSSRTGKSSRHTNKSFIGAGKSFSRAGKSLKHVKNDKNHVFCPRTVSGGHLVVKKRQLAMTAIFPGKSGGGPPHSKTLTRGTKAPEGAKRLGLRQSSGALAGRVTGMKSIYAPKRVATLCPKRIPGTSMSRYKTQDTKMVPKVVVPSKTQK